MSKMANEKHSQREIMEDALVFNKPDYVVFWLAVMMALSVPVRIILQRFRSHLPLTVILYPIAFACALYIATVDGYESWKSIFKQPPRSFMDIFLPIFITASIYRLDYYIFARCLPQVLLITCFGAVFTPLMFSWILCYILHPNWTYIQGVLIALTTLPIQPYHVLKLFQELTKYRYLGTILEAESVILTVPAFIFYDIFIGIATGMISQWYQAVFTMGRYLVGGAMVGWLLGKVMAMLLRWLYNEPLGALRVSIGMTYLTFYLSQYILDTSGTLAVIVLNFIAIAEKHRFTSEVDNCLMQMWNAMHYIAEIVVILLSTSSLTIYAVKYIEVRHLYGTIIIYFTGIILRFIRFLILGPILNRMTYEMNLKCLLVLSWSDVKGCINLSMLLMLFTNRDTTLIAKSCVLEIMVYTFLSSFINNASMKLILRLMRLSFLSTERKLNMEYCLQYIAEKRLAIIDVLKLDRYLAMANWGIVQSDTIVKVTNNSTEAETEGERDVSEMLWNVGVASCPGCATDIPSEITQRELGDVLKETQLNILKAKKVAVMNQYARGTINKMCLQVLVHYIEIMSESKKMCDFLNEKNFLEIRKFWVRLRKCVKFFCRHPHYEPPHTQFRRLCFYIVMHVAYDFIMYAITVCNAFVSCYHGRSASDPHWMLLYHYTMVLPYFTDCSLRLLALSKKMFIVSALKPYFNRPWNIFDFTLLLLCFVNMHWITVDTVYAWIINYVIISFRTIAVVRLMRFVHLFSVFCPHIIKLIDYRVDMRICFDYAIASALINCGDEVLQNMKQIVELKMLQDLFGKEIAEERNMLVRKMDRIQKLRPRIAITEKTRQAIRTSLTEMQLTLNELKSSGFVDSVEYMFIFKEIFDKQKMLRNMKFVEITSARRLFCDVAWMGDVTVEYLYANVQAVSWEAGQKIAWPGKHTTGVYVLITGELRLVCDGGGAPRQHGEIPVVDYLDTIDFQAPAALKLRTGNTIGELCVLTGRAYDCTIYAAVPSRAYWLSSDTLREAMRLDENPVNGLETRMWKYAILNCAIAIMTNEPLYQSYTQEQLKAKLENAFVPNLTCYKIFMVTDRMDDIILVQGIASDYNTGQVFTAPQLIPRSIQKLLLPKSSFLRLECTVDTKLLIIPMGDAKIFTIMEHEEDVAELVEHPSSRCLLHAEQARERSRQQRKRVSQTNAHQIILTVESSMEVVASDWDMTKGIISLDRGRSNLQRVSITSEREPSDSTSSLGEATQIMFLKKNYVFPGTPSTSIDISNEELEFVRNSKAVSISRTPDRPSKM